MLLANERAYSAQRISLERPKLAFDVAFDYERDKRSGPFIDTDNSSATYSEKLDITTEGWIYHSALLAYELELSPEWEQITKRSEDKGKTESDAFLAGYFSEFTFLQYKPYTLTIYGNRDMSRIQNSFTETSKSQNDSYGARIQIKYPVLPSTFIYNHDESSQTGFFESNRQQDDVKINIMYDKHLGSSTLNGSFIDSDQSTTNSLIEKNEYRASFSNIYKFRNRASLNSNISFQDGDGSNIHSRRHSIFESLNWTHRGNLSSSYNIRYDKSSSFDKNSSRTIRSRFKSVGFKLRHLLYENLSTTINVDSSESNLSSLRSSNYGGGVNIDYRRSIPRGFINITMKQNYSITDNRLKLSEGINVSVIKELHDLAFGTTSLFENTNVNKESITVNDPTLSGCAGFTCIEDIDYKIVTIGNSTGIRPLGFLNGKRVEINYTYQSNPVFDYAVYSQSYGINLNLWSTLRLFYNVDVAKQFERDGTPPDDLIDDSIHTAGSEFEWKFTKTQFKWEDWYTVNAPLRKWDIKEAFTFNPIENVYVRLSATYGESVFKETGDKDRFVGFKSDAQALLNSNTLISVSAIRDNITSSTEKRINTGFESSLELAYRIYKLNLSYRFADEREEMTEEQSSNHHLSFALRRTLF